MNQSNDTNETSSVSRPVLYIGGLVVLVLFGSGIGISGAVTGGEGCSGEGEDYTLSANFPENKVVVQGVIVDQTNAPLDGAVVTYQNAGGESVSATTNSAGEYTLNVETGEWNVSVAAESFIPSLSRSSYSRNGLAKRNFVLNKVQKEGTISAEDGGTLAINGASVVVPPNGLMNQDGSPATGEVTWRMTYIDPADSSALQSLPPLGGIRILGAVYVDFFVDGQAANIAKGSTAKLSLPLDKDVDTDALGEYRSWAFDEEKLAWVDEGEGRFEMVDGAPFWTAEVTHFSNRAGGKEQEKVWVCHVPPGNLLNISKLEVGLDSLESHLANGSFLGSENPDEPCEDLVNLIRQCDGEIAIEGCIGDAPTLEPSQCDRLEAYLNNINRQLSRGSVNVDNPHHADPRIEDIDFCDDTNPPACTKPEPEVCDGLDNDCDNQVDEESEACLGGFRCVKYQGSYSCIGI